MEIHLKFRLNILCLRNVPRFHKYLPSKLLEEPSTEGKVIWADVETSSFTQTLDELKVCVKGEYTRNNEEEGWISYVEFREECGGI